MTTGLPAAFEVLGRGRRKWAVAHPGPGPTPPEGWSPCPLGPCTGHLGCPGVPWCGELGGQLPSLWRPAPILPMLPLGKQWGQELVPLPQLKIAGLRLGGNPPGGGGRSGATGLGPPGVRLGRKCPGAPAPAAEVPLVAQPPGKSQAVPGTRVGQESPRSLASWRGGLPHTPAGDHCLGLAFLAPRKPGWS